MTMFPTDQQNRDGGYGGGCGGGGAYLGSGYVDDCCIISGACLGSDLMAEDESRTESVNNDEVGSSSKEEIKLDNDDQDWLRLSIGTGHTDQSSGGTGRLVELDLLPGGSGRGGGGSGSGTGGSLQEMRPVQPPSFIFQVPDFPATNLTSPFFFQPRESTSTNYSPSFRQYHQQEINTNYLPFSPLNINPILRSVTAAPPHPLSSSSSSFSASLDPGGGGGSYFHRQFHGGLELAGPSFDLKVVAPPRRPHSGVWFILQASQNQAKEPFLPQIPKSYLRIKDGRMTVRLLIKYLVNKLKLESESEIEITCKGEHLLPSLTLQHVRDNLWNTSRKDDVILTLVPQSPASASDHLMVLHYGRIA